jgi:hypothetical protein
MSDYQTCRICGDRSYEPHEDMIRRGTRHWVHVSCFTDRNKTKPVSRLGLTEAQLRRVLRFMRFARERRAAAEAQP